MYKIEKKKEWPNTVVDVYFQKSDYILIK